MNPERWQQVKRLYHLARDREPGQRAAFLAEACGDSAELRQEVESLLAQESTSDHRLDRPAWEAVTVSGDVSKAPRLTSGTQLGPYLIDALLGAGGVGEVYRARDTRLQRNVAVKVLSTHAADPDRVRRFLQEAQAASGLDHPNIVTIYYVGSEGDIDFIAMELVAGQNLAALIPQQGLPLDSVLKIALQIADALGAAHAGGVIHRDLKPGNIMVTGDGRVKLLDFGLAKIPRDPRSDAPRTLDGAVFGTFAYMSPEQLNGKPVDPRADIFAFGAVLYEMLAGRRAFPGESAASIATAVLHHEPAPLVGVAPELQDVVNRCLRKTLSERYARVSEVKSALERLATPSTEAPRSIAVLPFTNLSAEKENEYFSDGLAEEIIDLLSRVPGLKVTARTSAFAFRGQDQDIRKIGEALGVRAILEGSVRRSGNRIRVTAQLIDTGDGYHLWSQRYDREMTDVFALQDEISRAITDTLKPKLASPERAPARRTPNLEAYHAYLKGRYHLYKLTPDAAARAQAYFEEAIALDPNYAPAHAVLAGCFVLTAAHGVKSAHEVMPLARAAALKAVELDATHPEAQAWLARVNGEYDYDWSESLRRCRLALACESVSPEDRAGCVLFILNPLRRREEAMAALQPALISDPLSPMPRLILAYTLYAFGSYEPAIEQLRQLLEVYEHFWSTHLFLGLAYTTMGKTAEAIASLEKGFQIGSWHPFMVGLLAANYVRAGDRERAASVLATLEAPEQIHRRAVSYATYHIVCSEFDRAAVYFDRAIEERHPYAIFLSCLPLAEEFRQSPQGRAAMRKLNLE